MAVTLKEFTKKEYEKFTFILGNRPVDASYARKKRREIEHNGNCIPQIKEWILTINEKNEIVDGQAHWKAILEYNKKYPKCPIQTISCCVEKDAGLDRAKEINNNVHTQWKEKDYFASYIACGYADYEVLQRYRSTPAGKACGLSVVLRVCGYLEDENAERKFKKGEFVMFRTDEKDIMEILDAIAKCKTALTKTIGHRSVSIPAFMKCLMVKDVNRAMLAEKVSCPPINARNFQYAFTEERAVKNIEICYNYKLDKLSPARLEIFSLYRDTTSVNWTQLRSFVKLPTKKVNIPKKGTLQDDGVVPV